MQNHTTIHALRGIAATLMLAACGVVAHASVPDGGIAEDADSLALVAIDHPQRDTVATLFERTGAAPDAEVIAGTNYRDGKAKIVVAYDGMRPAALFGGDVTAYVLWAVEPDGHAKNLGELTIRGDDDGRQEFTTRLKEFALLITGEAHYLAARPSALVLFKSTITNEKDARIHPFTLDDLPPAPARDLESIDGVRRRLGAPVDLIQARKAFELADRAGAYLPISSEQREARRYLDHAEQLARQGHTGRLFRNACRSSVTHSHQALVRIQEVAELSARQAEESRLAEASARAADHVARASAAEARLEQERTKRERVEARLQEALSRFMETRRDERGLIVNLPDILFEVDKAELTHLARERLARAAELLRTEERVVLTIEGHADSTGVSEYNQRLSEARARAVGEVLAQHGIARERISTVGFGELRPLTHNDTPEARQRNRRVEIVVASPSS